MPEKLGRIGVDTETAGWSLLSTKIYRKKCWANNPRGWGAVWCATGLGPLTSAIGKPTATCAVVIPSVLIRPDPPEAPQLVGRRLAIRGPFEANRIHKSIHESIHENIRQTSVVLLNSPIFSAHGFQSSITLITVHPPFRKKTVLQLCITVFPIETTKGWLMFCTQKASLQHAARMAERSSILHLRFYWGWRLVQPPPSGEVDGHVPPAVIGEVPRGPPQEQRDEWAERLKRGHPGGEQHRASG